MVSKETILEVLKEQKRNLEKSKLGVEREILSKIDKKISLAIIISGIRRCGKSTLLHQISREYPKFNYCNFEDQRLSGFELNDFEKLENCFNELNGEQKVYFFDEIQNVPEWERYVRTRHDYNSKIYITGSNASMLSRELGTKLTGRYLQKEMWTFSYFEFLEYTKMTQSLDSFKKYSEFGGFPIYLETKNIEALQQIFKDILYRDVIIRYGLKNDKIIEKLGLYLVSNYSKEFSYNKLKEIFSLGSATSAINYINYFENAYMIQTIQKYDYSLKKQMVNPKKVYCIDTGFIKANSFSISPNEGRILENMVFNHLRRLYKEIYYFKEKNECDFFVKNEGICIQVTLKLDNDNLERELNGLKEAMEYTKSKKGFIITLDQEDKFDNIKAIPAWKWMAE